VLLLLTAVGGTSYASRKAVTSALVVAESVNVSPAVIGLTVMAIGTDLPEIANSIVSTATGHGDVNVGDSMGSVLTQVTLTLGILCFMGGKISLNTNFVIAVGTATVFATVGVAILASDGRLGHGDGLILIVLWLAGTALLGHGELSQREEIQPASRAKVSGAILATFGWLAIVGGLAVTMVESFLRLAETFGIPEFVGSFIALSLGTSLPELFVDWTAIRRGASSMAIGDIFGSSFVDATLSVGIGPALFASQVSSGVSAATGLAAAGVLAATVLTARSRRYDWRLGTSLLIVYAIVQIGIAIVGSSVG